MTFPVFSRQFSWDQEVGEKCEWNMEKDMIERATSCEWLFFKSFSNLILDTYFYFISYIVIKLVSKSESKILEF